MNHTKHKAYIVLAHTQNGDYETVEWQIATGKDAYFKAKCDAEKLVAKGFAYVAIRETSDDLYGGFVEFVRSRNVHLDLTEA